MTDIAPLLNLGYTLKYSFLIRKGTIAQHDNELFFHPHDFIPVVQKYYGSDAALDALRKIIHAQIDKGVFLKWH
jgi:hypothetical protein